MNADESEQKA
jgi:hypothetical protein